MNRGDASSIGAGKRLVAVLCVATLLALGVFGSSASLHAALHPCDQPSSGHVHHGWDGCAVDLYASGVSMPLDVPSTVPAPLERVLEREVPFVRAVDAAPDFRLPPGRGPPRS